MLDDIFTSLPDQYVSQSVAQPTTYYFSLGDFKKTVSLLPDKCVVEDGRVVDDADCVCKTSPEFFLKIWEEEYRPGMGDFISGTIKSNNPDALRVFLEAFGKSA